MLCFFVPAMMIACADRFDITDGYGPLVRRGTAAAKPEAPYR
jgi:hypothetical protein